jgi:hypothetical protein
LGIVNDGITTFGQAFQAYAAFVGNPAGRVVFMVDQVMSKMLPDPFFGAEENVFTPKGVEDVVLSVFFT